MVLSPPPTDWSFEPTDVRDSSRRHVVVPWSSEMDAPVGIDVAALLGPSEVPTSVSAKLWRLKAYGESDHTDVTSETTLPGEPVVSGASLSQRVKSLERGRDYRLYFVFGPTGNVRVRSIVISVNRTA